MYLSGALAEKPEFRVWLSLRLFTSPSRPCITPANPDCLPRENFGNLDAAALERIATQRNLEA